MRSKAYRTLAIILIPLVLFGCASSSPLRPGQPPLIQFQPSPGRSDGTEDLESDPLSDKYISFVASTPITKFYKILKKVDCNDWVYTRWMRPQQVIDNAHHYVNPNKKYAYRGDKPLLLCIDKFHFKYRNKEDDRLEGSDGILFDGMSGGVTGEIGLTTRSEKAVMPGWTVKFFDPTIEDIRTRLKKPVLSVIDAHQMRAAIYWIVTNNAVELIPELKQVLPLYEPISTARPRGMYGWEDYTEDALKALATIEPNDADDEIYHTIMGAGLKELDPTDLRRKYPDPKDYGKVRSALIPTLLRRGNLAPFVAANVLVCRNKPGTIEKMNTYLRRGGSSSRVDAAAYALEHLGRTDLIKKNKDEGNYQGFYSPGMPAGMAKYRCPYKSF